MKKLCELVTIAANNEECVILKVNEDAHFDLITLGCFTGDEKMLRLTKGDDHTATVFTDERNYSWSWGRSGYTIVSESMSKKGRLIQSCIEEDFGIYIGKNISKIRSTLHIQSLADKSNVDHMLRILYWNESDKPCNIHKDGEHFKWLDGVPEARKYVENNFHVRSKNISNSPQTGCFIEEYEVTTK